MKKLLFLLLFCLPLLRLFAQSPADSCHLRISLVTCSPGEDLYSLFGHTGIRLIDSARNLDVVFNYGTFDDSDPYFYVKFTRGIMRYSLSVWPYNNFMEEYRDEHRGVSEQVLQLNCADKQKMAAALFNNAQEANRYYNYQFHLDNCTTRARDMIAGYAGAPVHFGHVLPLNPPSFRQLIHQYLDEGKQYWSKFGIDLSLGSHLDAKVTNEQAMFLPDYLAKGLDSATVADRKLVSETRELLPAASRQPGSAWFSPLALFTAWLVIAIILSLISSAGAQKALSVLDRLLFLFTGLAGLLIWALWLTRVDTVCRNNWNALWALPTHIVAAFLVNKKRTWLKAYWTATIVLLVVALTGWPLWIPQAYNAAVAPIMLLLLLSSYRQLKKQ